MLFVAQGREQELIEIFHRWGLHAGGRTVISEPVVRILFQ